MVQTERKSLFERRGVVAFQGKTKNYCIETQMTPNGHVFTDTPEYSGLVEVVTNLYLAVYANRDRDISIERMRKSLSHPRTILELATYKGNPVGFGIFPRLIISGEQVLYSTRAFKEDHEGEGLGTHVLSEAIRLHQGESAKAHRSLRWGALMTQNPLSVLTLRKLDLIELIYPFDALYGGKNRQAQSLLLGIHKAVYMSSRGIDTITGVSKGELSEIGMNETYRPSREHTRAWEIFQKMISPAPDGFGMNREAGDVVYVLFKFKKPYAGSLTPLAKAV